MIAQLVNRIAYAASLHFDVLTPPRKAPHSGSVPNNGGARPQVKTSRERSRPRR
jgi:hypothetical protein